MAIFECNNCHRAYPRRGLPYKCPHCGGIYGLAGVIDFRSDEVNATLPGLWRYRHTFGLPEKAQAVFLGEGDTPLVEAKGFGKRLAFKLEYL